jgi:hypothetical protein
METGFKSAAMRLRRRLRIGIPRRNRFGNPRRENRLALNFYNVHAVIMSYLPKNQKPPVGFQA